MNICKKKRGSRNNVGKKKYSLQSYIEYAMVFMRCEIKGYMENTRLS